MAPNGDSSLSSPAGSNYTTASESGGPVSLQQLEHSGTATGEAAMAMAALNNDLKAQQLQQQQVGSLSSHHYSLPMSLLEVL